MSHQIVLHHLNASRSERLFWLLEELGLPYTVKVYYRLPGGAGPPELKKVHPFGRAPVVELDGELLAESGSIVRRLLALKDAPGRENLEDVTGDDSAFWSHWCEGSLMTFFQASALIGGSSQAFLAGAGGPISEEGNKSVGDYATWVTTNVLGAQSKVHLQEIEAYLAAHPGKYFSGTDKPGEGDILMLFPIRSLFEGSRKGKFEVGPATKAWFDKVKARPAVKKAFERLAKEEEGQKKSNL
ncbi:hypothetical protein M231_03664 [Tremella mesenterica]|uniref:Glutathione S-transferase n=1 Tax=Tremella mesenterica TaxID=5217 RepID=A0A4Q1BMS9_TREME|nr:hypothetical protein M231_03664 [Tremella mesenterica]